MKKGKLIVIEGIDGSGKSTLCNNLRDKGFVVFAQPTRENIGAFARQYQVNNSLNVPDGIRDDIVNLLITADRFHQFHKEAGVIDHLNKGKTVILDRHYISGIAYGSEELIDAETNLVLHSKLPKPDKVIYLDLSPEEADVRLSSSGRDTLDEYETLSYLKKRHVRYNKALSMVRNIGIPVVVVDATFPKDVIVNVVVEEINRCLNS